MGLGVFLLVVACALSFLAGFMVKDKSGYWAPASVMAYIYLVCGICVMGGII